MRYLAVAALAVFWLSMGCAAPGVAPGEQGQPPAIEAFWAPEAVRENTYWRLYLKVADADCDLAALYARVHQLGRGGFPVQQFNLGGSDRCGASGQITMWLGPEFLWSARLTVAVWAKDAAGGNSRRLELPLLVDGPPETVPPEEFRGPEFERTLGTISARPRSPIFDGGRPGIRGFGR